MHLSYEDKRVVEARVLFVFDTDEDNEDGE